MLSVRISTCQLGQWGTLPHAPWLDSHRATTPSAEVSTAFLSHHTHLNQQKVRLSLPSFHMAGVQVIVQIPSDLLSSLPLKDVVSFLSAQGLMHKNIITDTSLNYPFHPPHPTLYGHKTYQVGLLRKAKQGFLYRLWLRLK